MIEQPAERASGRVGRTAIVLLLGIVIASCRDVGLRGNIPITEARARPFRYSTYTMAQDHTHTIDGRVWTVAGKAIEIPARLLVRASDTSALHALAWDAPPYDRLFVPEPAGWVPLAPVR